MKLKLNDSIISPEDLRDIIEELRVFAKNYHHQNIKDKVLKTSLASQEANLKNLSEEASKIVRQFLEQKSLLATDVDQLISQLEKYLDQCLKIRITLASLPNLTIKKSLVNWCRENISEDILIDFRFNRYILGGMVINFKSHTYDLSFREKIIARQDKLREVIQGV